MIEGQQVEGQQGTSLH